MPCVVLYFACPVFQDVVSDGVQGMSGVQGIVSLFLCYAAYDKFIALASYGRGFHILVL